MTDFAKMDIFFLVTTTAVVVVGILVAVGLLFVIRILRNVDELSHEVTEEAKVLRGDIEEARVSAKREGFKLAQFLGIMKRAQKRHKKRSTEV